MKAGVHRKYEVTRTDGQSAPGGKHDGCVYFVLDLDHDDHAAVALKAYAKACRATNPRLAAEILDMLATPSTRCSCREASCPHSLGQALLPDGPADRARQLMDRKVAR